MYFSRVLSFAALASTALLAYAKPVQRTDNAVDLLPSFQSLEQKVSASANELDGNADPTGILAEIEACLQVTLGDLLQLDLHAQVDANVDDVVDAVAKTYTDVTSGLQKYEGAAVEEIVNAVNSGEDALAGLFSKLFGTTDNHLPGFANKVISAVQARNDELDIHIHLHLCIDLLGLVQLELEL